MRHAIAILLALLAAHIVRAQEPPIHKLKVAWKKETLVEPPLHPGIPLEARPSAVETEKWTKKFLDAKTPMLFGGTPIVVGDILYYRDQASLDAVAIRDHVVNVRRERKLKNSEFVWRSTDLYGSLVCLLDDARTKSAIQAHVANRGALLWENALCGSPSADDSFVYTIDDACLFQQPQVPRPGFPISNMGFPEYVKPLWSENILYCFELKDGRARWSLGGANILKSLNPFDRIPDRYLQDPFNECHFLGSPLPHDKLLWVTAERKNGDLELVRINPHKVNDYRPEVAAKFVIMNIPPAWRFGRNPCRRLANAQPLAVGDRIVCPTYAGNVFAWDKKKDALAWTFTYNEPPKDLTEPALQWKPSVPLVSGETLVLAPTDGAFLYCIAIDDGKLKWKQPRQADDLYLAAATEAHACVVTGKGVRFARLDDGNATSVLDLGKVSGRGVRVADRFYVPLESRTGAKTPSIAVVHLVHQKVIEHLDVEEIPGNLVWNDGQLLGQPPLYILAYEKLK